MRCLGTETKTPAEKVTLTANWIRELNGASVSSVSWDAGGLTNENTATTSPLTSIRVAGGISGNVYRVAASMTSSTGEISEAYWNIQVD